MSTEQFIPSSPVLASSNTRDADLQDDFLPSLPKKSQLLTTPTRVRHEYPTPNPSSDFPSSSAGFHSPVKETNVETSPLRPELVESPATSSPIRLSTDSKYKFISPMDNVKIVKLTVGQECKIGRSSKSCDIQLNKLNISKTHAILNLDLTHLTIQCLGRNGMNLTIPKPVTVKFLGEPDQYLVEPLTKESARDLNKKGLSKISRCNQKYDNLTNIIVLCNEVVKIPRIKGILLDIWDEFVLLNLDDVEKLSDDAVIVNKMSQVDNSSNKVAMCYKPSDPMESDIFSKPVTAKKEKRGRPKSQSSPSPAPHTKLHPHNKRVKQQEELPVELYKDITDEEVESRLSKIDDLSTIENVLINHLAFSRLSSTPISVLQKISHKTMELSKLDLQLILIKEIKCCGVIYRVGKDAAGKQLEEEYYYQIDLDDDQDRKLLVNNLKGESGSLRSCRKVHKQYFWKKPKSTK